jgi:hypothetical protein
MILIGGSYLPKYGQPHFRQEAARIDIQVARITLG